MWSYKCMLGQSFGVSVIHRTLTWTTGYLTCVYVIILMRAYNNTHGAWAHRQWVSTTFFSRKNSLRFSCAPDGDSNSRHGMWNTTLYLYQLSHHAIPNAFHLLPFVCFLCPHSSLCVCVCPDMTLGSRLKLLSSRICVCACEFCCTVFTIKFISVYYFCEAPCALEGAI